ncbi:MAG TPA: cellulase family glycosylhydrolase [Polyangiales bacterium]
MTRVCRVLPGMRQLALLVGALLVGSLAAVDAAAQAPGFVQVQGTQFVLDGQPFRFLGANVSVLHGPREREGYEQVLDAVVADGLRVVRLWALGEQLAPGEAYHPLYAFRIGESGWLETSFVHLDRVLAAAGARGLKVIVVLANRWKDYGGIATYLRWGGASVPLDELGEPLGSALTAFFDCSACQAQYREHLTRMVGRTNSVTGVAYRDDPTIMAWELINEASAVGARDEEVLLRWVKESADLIRSLDDRHLISAGHIGYHGARERGVWRAVQSLPEVDFADAHLYPQNDLRVAQLGQLPALLDDPVALSALAIHKPLVIGEFGFQRAPQRVAGSRERWTEAFLQHLSRRSAAGALVWLYEPSDNPRRAYTISSSAIDADSLRVRRVLRSAALTLTTQGPAAIPPAWTAANELPRFAPAVSMRGDPSPHTEFAARAGVQVLEIDVLAFASARFEHCGVHQRHPLEVVWGQGEGSLEYRFAAPARPPAVLRIEARVSSELPGIGPGGDVRDGSDVEISVDGVVIGTVRAPPDDGFGEVVSVELHDARLLRRLFRRARHTLVLRSLPSPFAGGLCVYGKPTALRPVPEPLQRALTALRVTLE